MAGKRRPPYFRVAFPGPVKAVSEETASEGRWRRRAYIDFGRYRLQEVVTSPQMDRVLDESGGDPDSVVGLGHCLIWRWVLSVSRDGQIERTGLLPFAAGLLAITGAFAAGGFVCLFIAVGVLDAADGGPLYGALELLSTVLLGLGLPSLWAVHMVMNVKAWCGA